MSENWNWQVSYKTPAGAMINIRTERADEMELALQSFHAIVPQILAGEQALTAGGHVAAGMPLSPPAQQRAAQAPAPLPAPAQPYAPQPVGYQQPGGPTPPSGVGQQYPQQQPRQPRCGHHNLPAKWVAPGISKTSGRPYAGFWACPLPKDQAGNCKVDA